MNQPSTLPGLTLPLSPKRGPTGHTPTGCRVLHVILKEEIFNRAKAHAYLSGLPFPEFVARQLAQSTPLSRSPQEFSNSNGSHAEKPSLLTSSERSGRWPL